MLHIDKITIATAKHPEMVAFYTALLGSEFRALSVEGAELHIALGPIEVWLIPRSTAEVIARDNVVQLRFFVKELYHLRTRLEAAGGILLGEIEVLGQECFAAARDPDGNVLELRSSTT